MDFIEVKLPGGVRAERGWQREAVVRPLSGRDEAFLLEEGSALPLAARATKILSRCVRRVGSCEAVTPEIARSLTVGDREALHLHLRRLTLGDKISCVLTCPIPGCGEKMDLDLRVSELLLPPYQHSTDVHEKIVRSGEASYVVRFRLPNGADQEAASPLAASEPDAAAEMILRRCVHEVVDESSGEPVPDLPACVAQALPEQLSELDPQAEIRLKLVCPMCRGSFVTGLDAADFFYRELLARGGDLYREIHLLAFHYHWSETEILRLSPRKRSLYIGLLDGALRGRSIQ
jgi:hypothetical protein